jgi:hypothetical protein
MTINQRYERKFEKRLIGALEKVGLKAIHLEPPGHPGWPDLLVVKYNRYLLVELKSVKDDPQKAIFEPSQRPFHYNWEHDTGNAVMVVTEVRDEDSYYMGKTMSVDFPGLVEVIRRLI